MSEVNESARTGHASVNHDSIDDLGDNFRNNPQLNPRNEVQTDSIKLEVQATVNKLALHKTADLQKRDL